MLNDLLDSPVGYAAALCLVIGWFTYWRPKLKAAQRRREFEAQALTNSATATYLYPLMGPDYLHQTLNAYERALALNERAVTQQAVAVSEPAAVPTYSRIPSDAWDAWPAPPAAPTPPPAAPATGSSTQPSTPAPSSHTPSALPQVFQVVFNEPAREPVASDVTPVGSDGPQFGPGEPTTLAEYGGQAEIVTYLQATIDALEPHEAATSPMALLGPAGLGKTALMRAFGNTLRLRNLATGFTRTPYIEVFPADLSTREDLDAIMRSVQGHPAVLQIDEIHTLDPEHAVLLYTLLAEGRYQFARARHATPFPLLTVLAATTDWAQCHPALRRRFEQLQLSPATPEDLARAVRMRPFPMTDEALQSLVDRTHWGGVLFEALRYYDQSVVFAKAEGATQVTLDHVEAVYRFNQLDNFGLTAPDRRIIQVLLGMPRTRRAGRQQPDELVCYGGPETQVAQVAGLDLGSYRLIHKPRLMQRQLLTTRQGYGQVLTERAVALYGKLAA